jgi:hypothetical protein
MYFSPAGRLCKMLPLCEMGQGSMCYSFAYLSRAGDEFSISCDNAHTIAAMREAPIVQPEFAARFEKAAA